MPASNWLPALEKRPPLAIAQDDKGVCLWQAGKAWQDPTVKCPSLFANSTTSESTSTKEVRDLCDEVIQDRCLSVGILTMVVLQDDLRLV